MNLYVGWIFLLTFAFTSAIAWELQFPAAGVYFSRYRLGQCNVYSNGDLGIQWEGMPARSVPGIFAPTYARFGQLDPAVPATCTWLSIDSKKSNNSALNVVLLTVKGTGPPPATIHATLPDLFTCGRPRTMFAYLEDENTVGLMLTAIPEPCPYTHMHGCGRPPVPPMAWIETRFYATTCTLVSASFCARAQRAVVGIGMQFKSAHSIFHQTTSICDVDGNLAFIPEAVYELA